MGTFAPASKMHFRNVQKFRKKYARVHVVVSSVRQKFRPKKTFYLTCVKKTKICHMCVICKSQKFLFFVNEN